MSLPTYPNIPIDRASRITGARTGRTTVTTMSGNVAQTIAYRAEKLNYQVQHTLLHDEHIDALENFYEENKYTRFEGNFDGVVRTWEFIDKPLYTTPKRFVRTYTVALREV